MTLIDIIFIVGVILFVAMLANATNPVKRDPNALLPNGIEPCPPHKWTYKEFKQLDGTSQERMVCDKCKHFPGQ